MWEIMREFKSELGPTMLLMGKILFFSIVGIVSFVVGFSVAEYLWS
jgi:hypothetical protein